jgi:16S rRNA (cytosine967-C5)-methyltransferase
LRPQVRARVVALYARAAADWRASPEVLRRAFAGARELHSRERRQAAEALYGMVRWRRRLAFVLGEEAPSPERLYLAWLWQEAGAAPAVATALAAGGIDPARLDARRSAIAAIADPVERLGVAESYPAWLVARLVGELGLDEAGALLAAMNARAPLVVRANRLKTDRAGLQAALAKEGVESAPFALAPDALALTTHINVYGLAAFKRGLFEVQDAGSQLIAELVAPPPRGLLVDACAGAGGKTLALGALLGNRGRIVAADVAGHKLRELALRARRAGLTNVQAVAVPARDPLPHLPRGLDGAAARVLVDAPCSGLGVLRRNPEARWRLSPSDLDELPEAQRAILSAYAALVAPGGRLVYATCTVTRAENDAVVEAFLAAHPGFAPVAAREILGASRAAEIGDGERLRLLPHHHGTDGFYAAVLRRR